jgi:hypothetical protein
MPPRPSGSRGHSHYKPSGFGPHARPQNGRGFSRDRGGGVGQKIDPSPETPRELRARSCRVSKKSRRGGGRRGEPSRRVGLGASSKSVAPGGFRGRGGAKKSPGRTRETGHRGQGAAGGSKNPKSRRPREGGCSRSVGGRSLERLSAFPPPADFRSLLAVGRAERRADPRKAAFM